MFFKIMFLLSFSWVFRFFCSFYIFCSIFARTSVRSSSLVLLAAKHAFFFECFAHFFEVSFLREGIVHDFGKRKFTIMFSTCFALVFVQQTLEHSVVVRGWVDVKLFHFSREFRFFRI